MGTAYTSTAYATIPNPCTLEFLTEWLPGLEQYRLDECDTSTWDTIYIYQGSGPGSRDIHYVADADEIQAVIDEHASTYPNGLRVAIEAGTVWQHLDGPAITLNRANIALTSFGTGHRPLFHGTETLAELGVTTLGSPTGGVYSVTLGSTEMSGKTMSFFLGDWGSDPRNALSNAPYVWKTSSGGVAAAGDFHYNSGTRVLTFYPHAGATLTTSGFRCITHTGVAFDGSMIFMQNYDKVVVRGIDVIGTAGNVSDNNGQVWSILSAAASTNAHLIQDCMGIYNSTHAIGSYTGTSGGIVTITDCDIGLQKHYQSIPIVCYAASGDHEYYIHKNRVYRWTVNDNLSTVIERSVQAIYSHTSGGSNYSKLGILAQNQCWCGQYGYGAGPYDGSATPANFDDDLITAYRVFQVGNVMDCGGYETRKNSGNAPRFLGILNGHVAINNLWDDIGFNRTTDTTTIEYLEIATTDYDYRGIGINNIWIINTGVVSGNHNFALLRNNLSSGTEPDRQGVYENQNWNSTLYITVPSGFSITGTWNGLSFQQNGGLTVATGNLNNGPHRMSWYNSLIINNSAANSSEDLILGCPEADPDGPRFTDAALSTARGGIQRTFFKGCKDQETEQGGTRNWGTEWFKANTSCADISAAYTDPLGVPATTDEWVVSSATALHASADGATLEYDFYGRPRPASGNRALGAVEAGTQADNIVTRTAITTAIGIGL